MAGFKDGGLYFSRKNSVNDPLSSDKVLLYVNIDGDIMARYSNGSEVNLTENISVTGSITRTEVANVTGQLTDRIDNLSKSDINDFVEGEYVHTTGNESISGIKTFDDDLFINGSLTVAGSATYIDVTDLRIEDNVIIVNRNETGSGVTLNYSGIEVERGTSPNVGVVWSESEGRFGATTGSTSASPTFEAFALVGDVAVISGAVDQNSLDITQLFVDVSAVSGSLGSMVIGIYPLNTVDKVYTINHPVTPVLWSVPMVSLTVPGSGSELLVDGVINRTTTSFDVVLSGTPEVTGYSLNWTINTAGDTFIGTSGVLSYVSAPNSPTDIGSQGQRAYDSNYVYECIDINTWVRYAAASSW